MCGFQREAQWRAVSVGLAAKRQETAQKLTEDLEAIENNSHGSIFLIKPMFAYKAKLESAFNSEWKRLTDVGQKMKKLSHA